jgi:hypothetical protein
LLVGTKEMLRKCAFPGVRLREVSLKPSPVVRVLGTMFDSNMKMESQVSAICRSSWFHLHVISKLRRSLSQKTCKKLMHAFVTSRIDMCNSLLTSISKKDILRLQRIQNAAARITCQLSKQEHISATPQSLHWLRIPQRITYKVALLVFKVLHRLAPQ